MMNIVKLVRVLTLLLALTLSGCSTYYPAQSKAKPHYVAVPHGRIEYYRIGQGGHAMIYQFPDEIAQTINQQGSA